MSSYSHLDELIDKWKKRAKDLKKIDPESTIYKYYANVYERCIKELTEVINGKLDQKSNFKK